MPQMPVNHGRRAGGGRYAERRRRLASASQMRQRRFGSYQSTWPCRRQPREVVARPSAATFTGGWWSEQYGVGVACAARTGTRQTQQRGVGMACMVAAGVVAPISCVWCGQVCGCSHTADRQCLCSDPLRCVGVWTFFLSIRIHTAADWLPMWLPRVHPPPCFPHAYGLSARSSTSLVMKGSAVRVRSSASLIPPAFPHYHGRYRHPARLGVIVRNRPEPTPSVTEWTAHGPRITARQVPQNGPPHTARQVGSRGITRSGRRE